MKHLLLKSLASIALVTGVYSNVLADGHGNHAAESKTIDKNMATAASTVERSIAVLKQQLDKSPDKRAPKALLSKAKCLAVFPGIVQGGLAIGGKTGRGLVSCRDETGVWGTPVFLRLSAISFGIQGGIQKSDVMMLVMNDKGLNSLFTGKPFVGAEVGIAVGPVGRQSSAALDVLLSTPIITYTRSEGLYAGASIEGATIVSSKKVNRAVYGDEFSTAKDLLGTSFESEQEFVTELKSVFANYAPVKAVELATDEEAIEEAMVEEAIVEAIVEEAIIEAIEEQAATKAVTEAVNKTVDAID